MCSKCPFYGGACERDPQRASPATSPLTAIPTPPLQASRKRKSPLLNTFTSFKQKWLCTQISIPRLARHVLSEVGNVIAKSRNVRYALLVQFHCLEPTNTIKARTARMSVDGFPLRAELGPKSPAPSQITVATWDGFCGVLGAKFHCSPMIPMHTSLIPRSSCLLHS